MIKRILLGLGDKAHSENKIRYALDLAKLHQAKVTAVTVVDTERLYHVGPVPLGGGAAAEELREHRLVETSERIAEVIAHFEPACQQASVNFAVCQEQGDPFQLLVEHSKFQDLMLFGLKGVFDYNIVTDRDEKPIDLLIRFIVAGVRPILAVNDGYRQISRVLVALSASVESARTFKQFVRMNPWPDAKLRIVTFDTDTAAGAARLEQAALYCQEYGKQADTKLFVSSPKGHIIEAADDFNADVIVMGNSAKSLLSRKVFGETALHCLQHADRPVFLNQ